MRASWGERVYRALARLYPSRIREHTDEMWRVVDRRARRLVEEGASWPRVRLWLFVFGDLARTLPAAHAATWRRRLWPRRAEVGQQVDVRPARTTRGMGPSWLDVKLGLRMVGKHPGLTLVAMFALAVGIPVGLAPAHFADAVEASLPVPDGDRVQALRFHDRVASRTEPLSLYDLARWRDELTAFESLGVASIGASFNFDSEDGRAEPVRGSTLAASTFDVLRVPPHVGRTLGPADEVPGAPLVVVISHDLWQSRMGAAADVVGRTVRLGGVVHTVIGIMPPGFLFPFRDHLWLPLRGAPDVDEHGGGRPHIVFGRLSEGVSVTEAQAELSAVAGRPSAAFEDAHDRLEPEVVTFARGFVGLPKRGFRTMPEYFLVQVAGLLILFVACSNVGMLIFARTADRSEELAVRTALGASRVRVVSQVFVEVLVFAVAAAGAGLIVADQIVARADHALTDMLGDAPYWLTLRVTPEAVVWALTLAVVSALVAGVVPALRVTSRSIEAGMRRAGTGRSVTAGGVWSGVLIVGDVAIAVGVVGLTVVFSDIVRDAWLADEVVGFPAEEYLSARVRVADVQDGGGAGGRPTDRAAATVAATHEELVRRLRAEPGVRGVAVANVLPRMDHVGRLIEVDGETRVGGRQYRVRTASVDVGFFDALGQRVLIGRGFDSGDASAASVGAGDAAPVIVNTTFAANVLGGQNPIGRRVRYRSAGDQDPSPWHEIIGVVPPLGMNVLIPDEGQGVYHPMAAGQVDPVQLAIHVGDDPASFTSTLRAIATEVDPTAVVSSPRPLDEIHQGDWYVMGAMALGGVLLVSVLLALAATGIYAIMSFSVARRTREIGVRAALGAARHRIAFMVARRAVLQLGIGIALGMPIAGFFFGLQNPEAREQAFLVALVPGMSVMVIVGLIACTAPTLRALRIPPSEALRDAR